MSNFNDKELERWAISIDAFNELLDSMYATFLEETGWEEDGEGFWMKHGKDELYSGEEAFYTELLDRGWGI